MDPLEGKTLEFILTELVKELGFEEMGKEVFEQIRHKDPLFYRYYISFRAIEESPLN